MEIIHPLKYIHVCGFPSEIATFLLLGERLVYEQKFMPAYGVSLFPASIISGGVSIATSFQVLDLIIQQNKFNTLKIPIDFESRRVGKLISYAKRF